MESAATGSAVHEWPPPHDLDETPAEDGLTAALGELEESTARLVALRQKLEQLGGGLADRRETLRAYDDELSAARLEAEQHRTTITRLEHELGSRESLFTHLQTELTGIAAELGVPQGNR
jgi:chromosome segregation ATPase